MNRISRLAPALANQIAAGEVVERPASVVKELIENAIDAGATRITITIEFGGKKLIVVEDDGEGMTAEDAQLAVERHATSKIRTAADLGAIRTLGFRGEALPSIASVSHFRLQTRARGATSGTEIRIDAGRLTNARTIGCAEGTLVEVADLFFNLPARRKFLKTDTGEAAQISRLVTQLALGYPEIGFTLRSADRTLLTAPPCNSLDDRFFQVYGDRPDLVPVLKQAAGITIRGFVAALAEQAPVRGPQHVFVNRRIVRDRTIAHAIQQAYSVATIKERSPEVHLFIELAPDQVDVNVHPTKAEVRFLNQSLVHEVLRRAIIDTFERAAAPELALAAALPRADTGATTPLPLGFSSGSSPAFAQAVPSWPLDARVDVTGGREAVGPLIRPMTPLGQFRNTFIIAVDDEGLAIVDQHVAHERILFEQIAERLTNGRLESQRLLTPIVMELTPAEHQTLAANRDVLARFGFDIDDFGGASLRIAAVPALLDWRGTDAALRAAAAELDGLGAGDSVSEALRRMAATTACHAAVKANDSLTREKMQYLLDELRRTAHSSVCPHGRPVVLRLTRREIERNFERT